MSGECADSGAKLYMAGMRQQLLRHVCYEGNLNMFVQASCVHSPSQSLSAHVTVSCDRD
jgi:hypothetical protein